MDVICKDIIGKIIEACVDDILVKSNDFLRHKEHLVKSFTRMREYHLNWIHSKDVHSELKLLTS